jgi:hypothetical protein
MKSYELMPTNGRKSFYGKVKIKVFADGSEVLQSYTTDVLKKTAEGVFIRLWSGWSTTTGAHIKSYCGMSKKEFEKLPMA